MQAQEKAVPEQAGKKSFVNLEGTKHPGTGTRSPSRRSGSWAAGTRAFPSSR